MIDIQFSGLSFQDDDFNNDFIKDGFLRPSKDFFAPIKGVWNNENYDIQNVIYNTYSFNIHLRDEIYQRFQKIQYAPILNIIQDDDIYSCKVVEFSSEPYLSEFWNVKVVVRDLTSKKVENPILRDIYGTITLHTDNTKNYHINLPIIEDVDYENSYIDTFKDNISNYRKTKFFKNLRFYLKRTELETFYTEISKISELSTYYIDVFRLQYTDFELKKQEVGIDLFQIDLKLFTNININSE